MLSFCSSEATAQDTCSCYFVAQGKNVDSGQNCSISDNLLFEVDEEVTYDELLEILLERKPNTGCGPEIGIDGVDVITSDDILSTKLDFNNCADIDLAGWWSVDLSSGGAYLTNVKCGIVVPGDSGFGSQDAGRATEPSAVPLINPIGGSEENPTGDVNIATMLGEFVSRALGVMGSLALVVFVYGGFLWLTSGGSEEKVDKGSKAMFWAAIGIFIVFSTYAILNLIINTLTS